MVRVELPLFGGGSYRFEGNLILNFLDHTEDGPAGLLECRGTVYTSSNTHGCSALEGLGVRTGRRRLVPRCLLSRLEGKAY